MKGESDRSLKFGKSAGVWLFNNPGWDTNDNLGKGKHIESDVRPRSSPLSHARFISCCFKISSYSIDLVPLRMTGNPPGRRCYCSEPCSHTGWIGQPASCTRDCSCVMTWRCVKGNLAASLLIADLWFALSAERGPKQHRAVDPRSRRRLDPPRPHPLGRVSLSPPLPTSIALLHALVIVLFVGSSSTHLPAESINV